MENRINEKEFLNLEEAGDLLGLTKQTVSKLTYAKDFPCTRLSRRILINRKKLLRWLEENVSKCRKLLTVKNIDMIAKEVYLICQKENNQNLTLKNLNKQKKEIYKKIDNLMKAIEGGENIDLINDRLTANRTELIAVEKKIKTEESKLIYLTKDQIKDFLLQLKNGNKNSIKYKKTLINIFVNKIFLYDDKLTIIFNVGKNPVSVDFPILEEPTNTNNNDNSLYLNKLASP